MASFNALARVATLGRASTLSRRGSPPRRLGASCPAKPPSLPRHRRHARLHRRQRAARLCCKRIAAFLTGAGLGCGVGYYHLAQEIKGSTAALEKAIAVNHTDLSDRLAKLEKK